MSCHLINVYICFNMCKGHVEKWVERSLQSNKVNASEEPAKGIKKINILTVDQ